MLLRKAVPEEPSRCRNWLEGTAADVCPLKYLRRTGFVPVPDPERLERVSALRQPTLTNMEEIEDDLPHTLEAYGGPCCIQACQVQKATCSVSSKDEESCYCFKSQRGNIGSGR
ncbi:hypothetical protein Tco_0998760 [Tanacetum coccineum]